MDDEFLAVACMPGLPHGAFRLWVILAEVAKRKGAPDEYFAVTLSGLKKIHPGTAQREAGVITVFKQLAELRKRELITTRGALRRDEPSLPVLVKVLYPGPSCTWTANDGSEMKAGAVEAAVGRQ